MLTAIVITKNEQEMIGDCLVSLKFADEIILVDTGNTDNTNSIAISHGAKIVTSTGTDYSQFRNDGLKAASGDWVLYLDADERISPQLSLEIRQLLTSAPATSAYKIPRKNIFLGKEMRYGGWGGETVIRLFKKQALVKWVNPLHEQPIYTGRLGSLQHEIIHFSHRDLSSMLEKTLLFTAYEAELRYKSGHPPVVWWRFIRVMATEFWLRFVKLQAFRDGVEGVIDGLFQVFNAFVIYARLWEMQYEKKGRNS